MEPERGQSLTIDDEKPLTPAWRRILKSLSQLPETFAWIICAGFMGWNFYNTSYFPIGALLGADLRKRDTLTLRWSDGKTAELQYVGLTAALIASVISAGFSWPTFILAPSICKACWYSALFMNLAAVTIATNQYITLQRLRSLEDSGSIIRKMLGSIKQDCERPVGGDGCQETYSAAADQKIDDSHGPLRQLADDLEAWDHRIMVSRKLGVYIWLLPSLMLRMAIWLFIIGMLTLLWMEPVSAEADEKRKVAIVSSVFFCLALFSHMFSMLWLSRHATPVIENTVEDTGKRALRRAKTLAVSAVLTPQRHILRRVDTESGRP